MLFKSREQVFKELNKIINQQLAEIEMLKGTIILKEKEIKFYEQRGDKYFVGLDAIEKTSSQLFELAKEILEKSVNTSTRTSND